MLKYFQLILFQAALIYLCNTGLANGLPKDDVSQLPAKFNLKNDRL